MRCGIIRQACMAVLTVPLCICRAAPASQPVAQGLRDCFFVAYLPDGKRAVVETVPRGPCIIALDKKVARVTWLPVPPSIVGSRFSRRAAISRDGKLFAANVISKTTLEKYTLVWRMGQHGCKLLQQLPDVGKINGTIAFSPSSRLVAVDDVYQGKPSSAGVQIWNLRTGKLAGYYPWPADGGNGAYAIAFLGNDRLAASLGHRLEAWNLRTHRVIMDKGNRLTFSMQSVGGGHQIIIAHGNVWSWTKSREWTARVPNAMLTHGAAEIARIGVPAGKIIMVMAWPLGDGLRDTRRPFARGTLVQAGLSFAVSRDKKYLVTPQFRFQGLATPTEYSSNFVVISMGTGKMVYVSPPTKGWIHSVAISPAGRDVLTVGNLGVRIWKLPFKL